MKEPEHLILKSDDKPPYDWSDPHRFHHGEGSEPHQHHVTDWKLLVVILLALLGLTAATVLVAEGELLLTANTDFPITQLWNVIIAMSIATVKAMLVCMYFMHLRHDNALNTYILLFTILVLGMFLTMPAIDLANRGLAKPESAGLINAGGTGGPGAPVSTPPLIFSGTPDRELLSTALVEHRRLEKIVELAFAPVDPPEDAYKADPGLGLPIPTEKTEQATDEQTGQTTERTITETVEISGYADLREWLEENGHWEAAKKHYWERYYHHKAEKAHGHGLKRHPGDDTDAYETHLAHHGHDRDVSDAGRRVVRRGFPVFEDHGHAADDAHHDDAHHDSQHDNHDDETHGGEPTP